MEFKGTVLRSLLSGKIKRTLMSFQNCLSNGGHYFNQGSITETERISTVDLLVLTSTNKLFFVLKILFTFFTKQPTLARRHRYLKNIDCLRFVMSLLLVSHFPSHFTFFAAATNSTNETNKAGSMSH